MKTFHQCRCVAGILFVLSLALAAPVEAQHQPLNVMVRNLTFTRPENWTWVPASTNSSVQVRFLISPKGEQFPTDVCFFASTNSAEKIEKGWKTHFPEADKPETFHKETVKIGQKEIIWLTWQGGYRASWKGKKQLLPGSKFVGVLIPDGEQTIQARLFGPKKEVEKAEADFKQMIKDAIQEQ